MPAIAPDTQLIPPTLLPLIHDCFHSATPLWYQELESVYRAVTNWEELILVHGEPRTFVPERGWFFGGFKRRRLLSVQTQERERLRGLETRWYLLARTRCQLFGHHFSWPDVSGLWIRNMLEMDKKQDKAAEDVLAASLGIVISIARDAVPPYIPERPPSAVNCITLRAAFRRAFECGSYKGRDECEEALKEAAGYGDEEAWACKEYQRKG
ncbi:hypothetical protein JCM10207_008730 [Rhodosporidiobolus poonsookiae]